MTLRDCVNSGSLRLIPIPFPQCQSRVRLSLTEEIKSSMLGQTKTGSLEKTRKTRQSEVSIWMGSLHCIQGHFESGRINMPRSWTPITPYNNNKSRWSVPCSALLRVPRPLPLEEASSDAAFLVDRTTARRSHVITTAGASSQITRRLWTLEEARSFRCPSPTVALHRPTRPSYICPPVAPSSMSTRSHG